MHIIKCGCGHKACNKYHLSGTGSEGRFDKEEAEAIALRYNTQPDLLKALKRLAHDCDSLNNPMVREKILKETLSEAYEAIAKAEK